jgi:hypothetical protein
MNTFFLSLLKEDMERRKNVTCTYHIETNTSRQNKYLKSRFPFLEVGDIIVICGNDSLLFWDGKIVVNRNPIVNHPFFFFYYEYFGWEMDQLSSDIVDRIPRSKSIRNFKIGKTRYEVISYHNYEEIDDYKSKYKKRLFID